MDEATQIQELIDKNSKSESNGGDEGIDKLINSGDAGGQHKEDDDSQSQHKEEPEGEHPEGEPTNQEEGGQSEADVLNVSKYFDGFKSLDEVKQTIQRGQQFSPEIEQELNTLRQSNKSVETLQSEVKQLKERQPFNNEKFYQFDKLSKDDPDKAALLMRYEFGDNSAESVLKLQMMLEHPNIMEDNPGFLQRKLVKKYQDFYSGDYTSDDEEYQDAKTAMELDADNARRLFDSEIAKIEIPKVKTDEQRTQETEAFFKGWVPSFSKVKEELAKIEIPVLDDKDEDRKSTRLNSSHIPLSRMPSSA